MGINSGAKMFFLFVMVLIFAYGWLILITTITMLHPALKSIKAIQTETGENDKVWFVIGWSFDSLRSRKLYPFPSRVYSLLELPSPRHLLYAFGSIIQWC